MPWASTTWLTQRPILESPLGIFPGSPWGLRGEVQDCSRERLRGLACLWGDTG